MVGTNPGPLAANMTARRRILSNIVKLIFIAATIARQGVALLGPVKGQRRDTLHRCAAAWGRYWSGSALTSNLPK